MKRLKTKLRYAVYTLLVVVLMTSCSIKAESDYNMRYWELRQKTMELEYLEKLYRIKRDIDAKAYIAKIDSLILNYN